MADVDAMLPHYFKQADGLGIFRGESVVGGRVFDIRNETKALTSLNAVLSEEPQTPGNLIPKWQQVPSRPQTAIAKALDQLLAENFGRVLAPGNGGHRRGLTREDVGATQYR